MAKNANVTLPRGVWTQISAASTAITECFVQNTGNNDIILQGMATEAAPAGTVNTGVVLAPGVGHEAFVMADIFKGVSSPAYLYALSVSHSGSVFISHA